MQGTHTIFNFSDAIEYLNYQFEIKRHRNSRFSLRAWARQLGYRNPSFLSHVLKRERSLKIDVAIKFSDNLGLAGNAKKYFEVLVLIGKSKTADEKKIYFDILDSLRPKSVQTFRSLNVDAFRVISDWYHTAILELIELSDFREDPHWIKERLGNEVSIPSIRSGFERLLSLGLIERTPQGKLSRKKDSHLLIESYIPSEAIRHFHTQMIDRAKTAMETQSIGERDIRGTMISVRMRDYAKVQEIIQKAHDEVLKYSCIKDGEELYQFNTQFFRITKRKEDL